MLCTLFVQRDVFWNLDRRNVPCAMNSLIIPAHSYCMISELQLVIHCVMPDHESRMLDLIADSSSAPSCTSDYRLCGVCNVVLNGNYFFCYTQAVKCT